LQNILCLGHGYTYRDLYPNKQLLPYRGDTAAKMIECYSLVIQKFEDFEFVPEFKIILKKLLTD